MAKFNMDRYNYMKTLFDNNGIDKKARSQFEVASTLRYYRHCKYIDCTDEQIIAVVNQEMKKEELNKGENYTPGCIHWRLNVE